MKKLLFSSAALLLCCLAHSQASDETGSIADVSLITRFDYNPYLGTGSNKGLFDYTFGNSSIYTLVEGQPTENLSFTICNHWLCEEPAGLYEGTGYSNTNNWLDMFYVDYSLGSWDVSVGKMAFGAGGREFEDWDYDVHYDLATPLWANMCCYQWGATIAWTSPSEMNTLKANFCTSPYGEHPFGSGLFAYTLRWDSDFGFLSNIWSISAMETEKGSFEYLACLSNRFSFGDFIFDLDWYNASDFDEDCRMFKGSTFRGNLQYCGSERFDAALCSYAVLPSKDLPLDPWYNVGTMFQYHPFKNAQALTLHATAAYNSLLEGVSLMVGIKANINIFSIR